MTELGTFANIATILTATIAGFGYGKYCLDQYCKRVRLENYLKSEMEKEIDQGHRTLLHLMAKLGMTKDELLQASFNSNHVKRKIAKNDDTGRAESMLLAWSE